jgi:hypothetical protein
MRRQFDSVGKIAWPEGLPKDPNIAESPRTAEDAIRDVVRESKTTGHTPIRPVDDAKDKLSAFKEKVLGTGEKALSDAFDPQGCEPGQSRSTKLEEYSRDRGFCPRPHAADPVCFCSRHSRRSLR